MSIQVASREINLGGASCGVPTFTCLPEPDRPENLYMLYVSSIANNTVTLKPLDFKNIESWSMPAQISKCCLATIKEIAQGKLIALHGDLAAKLTTPPTLILDFDGKKVNLGLAGGKRPYTPGEYSSLQGIYQTYQTGCMQKYQQAKILLEKKV